MPFCITLFVNGLYHDTKIFVGLVIYAKSKNVLNDCFRDTKDAIMNFLMLSGSDSEWNYSDLYYIVYTIFGCML